MRNNLKFILLFLAAIFILWFFGRSIDWEKAFESLQRARASYLILAIGVICLGYLLRAKRWAVLLSPITKTDLKELFATTTVGFAAVFFVGRMGEIVRPMWLPMRDKRVRPSAALVTLGVERIFDLSALATVFAVNLIWFEVPAGRENDFGYVKTAGIIMLIGVMAGIASLFVYSKISAPIIGAFEKRSFFSRRLKRVIISILRQLANALKILTNWRGLLEVVFWTVLLWFAIAFPTWLVLQAFDLPLTFSDSLFIMGFAAVSSVVPTPGGAAGAFHTATAASLIYLNTDKDVSAAVSIILHLVYFSPAVLFGLYYFLRGDISIARLRHLLSAEHAEEDIEHEDAPDLPIESLP